MQTSLSIPLGVVIAREKVSHPWQDFRWRPVSVFLDAPAKADWRELRRGAGFVHYHAATLTLELHRKETMAYRVNLANGAPSVYVVLRDDGEGETNAPIDVHRVTASPFEAQSHGDLGFDFVEGVAMPDRLVSLVQSFIDEHHVEETFYKRKRERALKPQEHKFGQEPIYVLRERAGESVSDPTAHIDPNRGNGNGNGTSKPGRKV